MNKYIKQSLHTLKSVMEIKSVKGKSTADCPFGEGPKKCLTYFLNIAKSLGFETVNYDNYIGEVVYGEGRDEDGLAILAHLDVVPEGDIASWKYQPYTLSFDGEYLYGRGVIDDKGPAVICLYAMKELLDSGFKPNRKIKLIVGTDEESGWGCIEHYKKVATFPREGFTPDGEFPVIYAEKGIYHVEYTFNVGGGIINILGGDRVNMVCDKVAIKLNDGEKLLEKARCFNGEYVQGEYVFSGKTAHGSTPELGDNAIKKALKFLVEIDKFSINDYNNLFENATGIKDISDQTGNLTFSPNVITFDDGKVYIKTDVRYPSTKNLDYIKSQLAKIGNYTELHYQSPLYNDKNGKLVKTLLDVFNKKTGRNDEAIAIGGGTYAKAIQNGVAFGASFDEDAHIPNEKQSLKNYCLCYDIYKEAIMLLTK